MAIQRYVTCMDYNYTYMVNRACIHACIQGYNRYSDRDPASSKQNVSSLSSMS